MTTKTLGVRIATGAALWACVLPVSCSSEKKSEPTKASKQATAAADTDKGTRTVAVVPGEAGGVLEETLTAVATVRGVNAATRAITLESQDGGTTATFTAPPEMRNFDQVQVGDRVTATIVSRLVVFVDKQGAAGDTQAAAMARTPKGAKPGAMVAESFEIVGTVKSIDSANRRATIEFSGGQTKNVPVRPDVDLTRYKAGDSVVIRVTQHLTILVEAP